MTWQVRRHPSGVWELVAPSGQVAGTAPTRDEAVEAVKYMRRVKELARRRVGPTWVPEMTPAMAATLRRRRHETTNQSQERAKQKDPALARYLNERKRRQAA